MKLPVVSGADAVKAFRKAGYELDEQHGSHRGRVAEKRLPRKAMLEQCERDCGQLCDPRDGAEQKQPHHQREQQPDALRARALRLRQAVAEDRNENQVIDAEHDFHHDQRDESGPGGGIDSECEQGIHDVAESGVPRAAEPPS